MSGALFSLFDSLFGASFRGVDFHIPDTRQEIGRRVVRFWFPGRDDTVHQDLGAYEGPISVSGFIVGDDYVARARALRAAFLEPGAGTLVHPWLGEIEVVLSQPATITFSERELRMARVEATFERAATTTASPIDTLQQLLDRVQQIRAQVRATIARILSPIRQTVALIAGVQGFVAAAASTWRGLVATGRGLAALGGGLDAGFRGLDGVPGLAADAEYGGAVADRLGAVPKAIGDAGAPPLPPAIGPAAGADIPGIVISPADAAVALLDAGDTLSALPAAIPELALAAAVQARLEAVAVAAGIEHASREEAIAWRDRLAAALDASARDAVALARTAPAEGQALWSAVAALGDAVAADYNDRIGRLPAVRILLPRADVASAWAIAHDLVGDDPAAVLPMMRDLIRRNGIRNPAVVPADRPLEYLA
jgi:prophage DNA circulation protein